MQTKETVESLESKNLIADLTLTENHLSRHRVIVQCVGSNHAAITQELFEDFAVKTLNGLHARPRERNSKALFALGAKLSVTVAAKLLDRDPLSDGDKAILV